MKKTLKLAAVLTIGLISLKATAMEAPTKAITSIEGPFLAEVLVALIPDPVAAGMFGTTSYPAFDSSFIRIAGHGTQHLMKKVALTEPGVDQVRLLVVTIMGNDRITTELNQAYINGAVASKQTLVIAGNGVATLRDEA